MAEWNRNDSRVYDVDGRKIVSKYHKKPIFFKRELFFYDFFGEDSLIKTPEIYMARNLNLQTYFIETEGKDDLRTAKEWAEVHSNFIRNVVKDSPLFIHHNIEEVSSYALENISIFGELASNVRARLSGVKMNKNLKTILHGDLQKKNMVTLNGENYYFDFELGGVGHPGRDIASMIISNPWKKENLLNTYRKNFDFDYSELREDVDSWLMARAAQLCVIFDKRQGTVKQKRIIRNKLFDIIRDL